MLTLARRTPRNSPSRIALAALLLSSSGADCCAQSAVLLNGKVRSTLSATALPLGINAGLVQTAFNPGFLPASLSLNPELLGGLTKKTPAIRILLRPGAIPVFSQKTGTADTSIPPSAASEPAAKTRPEDSLLTRLGNGVKLLQRSPPAESSRILDELYVQPAARDQEALWVTDAQTPTTPAHPRLLRADRRTSLRSCAEAPPPATASAPAPSRWQTWTKRMVLASGALFSVMQLPQIVKNFANLFSGRPEALAILPWMGYSTSILANMLLLSYFRSTGDKVTALAQAVGIATNVFVLCQIFAAGFMPLTAFLTILPTIATGLLFNWLHEKGRLPKRIWDGWERASNLLGITVLPQALWSALTSVLAPALTATLLPLAVGAGIGILMDYLSRNKQEVLPPWLKKCWKVIGACTATALFAYYPIVQHINSFLNPAGLAAIALPSLFMGLAGNMLLMPRMMHTRNGFGVFGNAWSIVGSWGILVWMRGYGLLSPMMFWSATAFIPAFLAFSHWMNRRHPPAKD